MTRPPDQTPMRTAVRRPPETADIALGAVVRIRRKMLGISQEQLAERCGVTFQQIQKYENGSNRISFSRLVLIARALRTTVRDLLSVLDAGEPLSERDLVFLLNLAGQDSLALLDSYDELPHDLRQSVLTMVRSLAPASKDA